MADPTTRASRRSTWRTPSTALTLLRMAAAPAIAAAIAGEAALTAGLLFTLAVATDFADGPLARRRGEQSTLGGLLDHASDAAFVASGLGALAARGSVPGMLPLLVAAAFVQYALDSRSTRGEPLRGSPLGHWNGIAYYVLLGIPVIRDALGLGWPGRGLVRSLGWALVATTLLSIADRLLALWRARLS